MKFLIRNTGGFVEKGECSKSSLAQYKLTLDCETYQGSNGEIYEGLFIEINSLEDLMKLYKDCKQELIISKSYFNDNILAIEIYDWWRE